MKKALLSSVLLILGLVLSTGAAVAGDPAPAMTSAVQTPLELELFTPAPQTVAICPEIGCVNDQYCRRDRDCTVAPGGVCNLFCATRGCCVYPTP